MRQTCLTRIFLSLLCALFLSLLPEQPRAQTLLPPGTEGGLPIQPGYSVTPGQNTTSYFNNQSAPLAGGNGQSGWGDYDAAVWFHYDGANPPLYGIPAGWTGMSSWMASCDPRGGSS